MSLGTDHSCRCLPGCAAAAAFRAARSPFFRSDPGPSDRASGAPGAPSGARTPCGAAPGSCSMGDNSCRNVQRHRSPRVQAQQPSRSGSGPRRITAASAASSPQSTVAAVDPWGDRAARPDPRCCTAAPHRAAPGAPSRPAAPLRPGSSRQARWQWRKAVPQPGPRLPPRQPTQLGRRSIFPDFER